MKSIRDKIRKRVGTLAVALVLIFAVMISILLLITTYKAMNSQVEALETAYKLSVNNNIETYKWRVEQIAKNDEITDPQLTLEERKNVLKRLSDEYGFKDISISDATGSTYNDTDISDREYFKAAMQGETYISSPVVRKTDSSMIMFAATRVSNSTGYNGVVYASLDSDTFSEMVRDANVGGKGYSFIVNKEGTIVAHRDSDHISNFTNYIELAKEDKSYKSAGKAFEKIIKNEKGIITFRLDKMLAYTRYEKIEGTDGWTLCVNASETEQMMNLFIGLAISAVFVIIAFVIARKISKDIADSIADPIGKITDRIKKLAGGDLKSPVPDINNDDETGVLAQSLKETVDSINLYIDDIDGVLGSISNKELNIEVEREYVGDFYSIKKSLNLIIKSLNDIFSNFNSATDTVASGAEEISATTTSLSEGTMEQAGVIEELLASFNEILEKVKVNMENAEDADKVVEFTIDSVKYGNIKMNELMESMQEINNASKEIEDIALTIQDIAEQTNLLALNAAIEAARAGDAGKGFAVVAEEVRNLAEQSSEAVKNTKDKIGKSILVADKGAEMAKETKETLEEIGKKVEDMSKKIGKIAESSKEQTVSIQQMTEGVNQIADVVQNNSATAEETAASTEELARQAEVLDSEIKKLKLK